VSTLPWACITARVGEVLGGDELDVAALAGELVGDERVERGIELGEGSGVEHGEKSEVMTVA